MSQEEVDPLHLGNVITILSEKHGLVTGRIVYRDITMVRIVSQEASDRALEFPLTPDGSMFLPELGVSDIEIIETQESDHFVDTLGARVGETLEFFTLDGEQAAPPGEVAEIFKTPTKDTIQLTDGRVLKFRGKGPELPIAVIRVSNAEEAVQNEKPEEATPAVPSVDILALLRDVLPPATVEVVPTADRTFPDSMQREDMIQDLLVDMSAKQRTNPRRIRFIEREVDLSLSLKNRTTLRDAGGRVTGVDALSIQTIGDAIQSAASVPVAIPIVRAAKVLNLDMDTEGGVTFKETDVFGRLLYQLEGESELMAQIYLNGSAPEFVSEERSSALREVAGRGFHSYIYDLLDRDQGTLHGEAGPGWKQDQDVIRTAGMGQAVQGLSKDLPVKGAVSMAHLISDVTDRQMRVLTSDVFTHPKTRASALLAPSDPSVVSGHVILPVKAALALRPPKTPGDLPTALLYTAALEHDNLPTITETLRDLFSPSPDVQHAWTLDAGNPFGIAEWLRSVLPYAIHPSDSMGPRTPRIMSVLDALGIGEHDMSPPVYAVVQDWVASSQQTLRNLIVQTREAVQKVLDAEAALTFDNVSGADSLLFRGMQNATLAEMVESATKRNPSIAGAGSMLTASLLNDAQGDSLPLLWSHIQKADTIPPTIDEAAAGAALVASHSYTLRRKVLRDINLLSLKAAPEISSCPHAKKLEAVRNVSDVLSRSRLLRDFIETYQSARQGDWMTCALCHGACVCYHELMELEALAQPTRMVSIQKQILIKFGGDRYQGKIVCRNCGQALQDIDYDEHVEFDDNGKAITGRSVLTEEQMAEPTETTWKIATADLAPTLTFASQTQREIGDALQVIAEKAGIRLTDDIARRIVRYTDLYVSFRAFTPVVYEKMRAKAMTSAATKIKVATGTQVATVDVPTYTAHIDQHRVIGLTSFLALALQSLNPPLEVNTPFTVCPFSREGWPFEPEKPKDGPGAVSYMSCVVAYIQRDMRPWVNMSWSGITKPDTRRKKVLDATIASLQVILSGDAKKGQLSFAPEVRTALTRAQTDVAARVKRSLVSHKDELTHGFRPEAFPAAVRRPAIEKNPLNMAGGPDLGAAVQQLNLAVVSEMHAAAVAGYSGKSNTPDAVCCPNTIQDVEAGALQGPSNVQLAAAAMLLRKANPSAAYAGAHLWSIQETPVPPAIDTTVDSGILFKLFLKFCYTGAQVGYPHEFSSGNICRQCNLRLGKPVDLIHFDTEGAEILAKQEGPLRIEITEAAFDGLSNAIRRTKKLREPAVAVKVTWKQGLDKMLETMARYPSLAELSAATQNVLTSLNDEATLDEMERAELWTPVAAVQDAVMAYVVDRVGPMVPRQPGRIAEARAKEAVAAMAAFNALTEDPFVEGPRAIQEYWCAKTSAAGQGFGVTSVVGAKWFKISPEHNDRLDKLLNENASWYGKPVTDDMRPVLRRLAEMLGPLLRAWLSHIRPAISTAWTATEARLLLRSLVLHAWRDALSITSWIYTDMPSAETTVSSIADWTLALMLHAKQQFTKYSKETIQQILQQRAELERTSVVQEFEAIKDDDQRAAELMKKTFRIGRWGVGKNLQKYDSELFEFESEQRLRMGIVDAPVDPLLLEGAAAPANDFGFGPAGGAEEGYDVEQQTADDA